jgi:hypothetical protein
VDLLQGIDSLLELNVLVRELCLLIGGAELLLDKLRRPRRKRRELGTARENKVSIKSTINSTQMALLNDKRDSKAIACRRGSDR